MGGGSGLQRMEVGETRTFPECQHITYAIASHQSSELQKKQFPGSKEGLGFRSELKGELCEELSGYRAKDYRSGVSSLDSFLTLALLIYILEIYILEILLAFLLPPSFRTY